MKNRFAAFTFLAMTFSSLTPALAGECLVSMSNPKSNILKEADLNQIYDCNNVCVVGLKDQKTIRVSNYYSSDILDYSTSKTHSDGTIDASATVHWHRSGDPLFYGLGGSSGSIHYGMKFNPTQGKLKLGLRKTALGFVDYYKYDDELSCQKLAPSSLESTLKSARAQHFLQNVKINEQGSIPSPWYVTDDGRLAQISNADPATFTAHIATLPQVGVPAINQVIDFRNTKGGQFTKLADLAAPNLLAERSPKIIDLSQFANETNFICALTSERDGTTFNVKLSKASTPSTEGDLKVVGTLTFLNKVPVGRKLFLGKNSNYILEEGYNGQPMALTINYYSAGEVKTLWGLSAPNALSIRGSLCIPQ